MCGRFGLFNPGSFRANFGTLNEPPQFELSYNIAPGAIVPVVTRHSPNTAALMKWGLVPFWAKDPRIGFKMINARAEGIEAKPAFRKPICSQRCLVPANGFYKWQKLKLEGKPERVPFFIRLKERAVFAFAGLSDVWKDAEDHEMRTFTIITTTPNELMADIHDRMPVILRKEDEDHWLDEATALASVLSLLKPYPAGEMAANPVSSLVNSPRNDSAELVAPRT
jgi:putative SOS response-associated peptidase YedK